MQGRFVSLAPFLERASGGFYYTLNAQGDDFDYLHCEITGYALSVLCRGNGGRDCLGGRSLNDIAGFLLRAQHADGGFPHSVARGPGFPDRQSEIHAFDTGICADALFDHSVVSKETGSLRAAEKALDWLEMALLPDSAGFHVVWCARTARWMDEERRGWWSSSGGCYHGKLIVPFLRGGRDRIADNLVEWLLSTQRKDGSWGAAPAQPAVHTHAMCYALEGLAYYAEHRKDSRVRSAVERGIEWLARLSESFEGIPEWVPDRTPRFRSDSQIQFLCLASRDKNDGRFKGAEECCRSRLARLRSELRVRSKCVPVWRLDDSQPEVTSRLASWSSLFAATLKQTDGLHVEPRGSDQEATNRELSGGIDSAISDQNPVTASGIRRDGYRVGEET